MNAQETWTRLGGALSLGLGRQPLPAVEGHGLEVLDEPARALALLALLGQRLRLVRPASQAGESWARVLPEDARPMLPAPARQALRRLDLRLDGENRRRLAPLVMAQLASAGVRVHIFDLPALEPMLRMAGDQLGQVERAWLGRRPETGASGDDAEAAAGGGPAERLATFREARRADPAAARDALVATLSSELAKQRADLVTSLAIGLSAEDRALLDVCLADRAQGVREAATALLARLPGSPAYDERLAEARAALSVEAKGLLRRQKRLTFRPPRKLANNPNAAFVLFDGFGLAALTGGLVRAADLPEMAAADTTALRLLARAAIWDGEPDLAGALLARIADSSWPGDLVSLPLDWALVGKEARRTLAAASFQPASQLGWGHQFFDLGDILGGAMEPALARRVLASPAWRSRIAQLARQAESNDKTDLDLQLLPMAAMMPPEAASDVASTLGAIAPVRRPKTAAMLALLDQLAGPFPSS